MENNYKKIRIIGCSGSGKTYLSKYLGNKYKIPIIKRKLHKENGKKESLKSLISLICWIYNYNRKEFPTISLVLKEYSEKVIYLNKKTAELI